MSSLSNEEIKKIVESSIDDIAELMKPLSKFTEYGDSMNDDELEEYFKGLSQRESLDFSKQLLDLNTFAQGKWTEILENVDKCKERGIVIERDEVISQIEKVMLGADRITAFLHYQTDGAEPAD